jgi:hypothetical protein
MKNFEQTGFAQSMASPAGRITRLVAGAGLMILGATQTSAKSKASLLAVGAIPSAQALLTFVLFHDCSKVRSGDIKSEAQRS